MQTTLFAQEATHTLPGYPCVISPCGQYRYVLYRIWNVVEKPRLLLWICLNPSIADANVTDPSLTRMIGFAKAWGYDGICVVNLFAFRSPKPAVMKSAADPVGDDCDYWIGAVAEHCEMAVAGWGADGSFQNRDKQIVALFSAWGRDLYCLKENADGAPMHPLFAKGDLQPAIWRKSS